MTQLHQVLAAEKTIKDVTHRVVTAAYQSIQKPAMLVGQTRNYRPMHDDGVQLPPEVTRVQLKATDVIDEVARAMTSLLDVVLTHETANQQASADVEVDGMVLVSKAPVSYLLFLEKQLTDLQTFITKLPVLDPAEDWEWDLNTSSYRTAVTSNLRREKRPVVLVKYQATDKHPAQTEIYNEDVAVGYWDTIKESGALPQTAVNQMWQRVTTLLQATRVARQKANSIETTSLVAGRRVLNYVFTGQPEREDDPGAKR